MKSRLTVLISLLALSSGCPGVDENPPGTDTLVIFHNGAGTMCLDALAWLETAKAEYPNLRVEEHLTTQQASVDLLREMKAEYDGSQGVSATFGYLPIVFYHGQAFSGFNDAVESSLAALMASGAG